MRAIRIVIPVLPCNIDHYIDAMRALGAEPLVRTDAEGLDAGSFDGLLLPGGGDIDPACYGCENRACMMVSDALDDLQSAYLDAAVRAGKPVFGICRGHQLVNVYFGGTLIQDVGTARVHARDVLTGPDKRHEAAVSGPDSYLRPLYGDRFRINSSHHQAVDRLGEGMTADLYSVGDHLIEAAHHRTKPVWTVQWHPERCFPSEEEPDLVDGRTVLRFFLDRVRERTIQ